MKKKYFISILILFCGVAVIVGCSILLKHKDEKNMERDGNVLIHNIEQFSVQHNRLPESDEILESETESGRGPFYKKISNQTYIVYFTLGFDEYYTYKSETKIWDYQP